MLLPHQKKKQKQKQKQNTLPRIQNVKKILGTTFVEILPRSMHEFLESNCLCTFRQDVV